MAHTLDLFFDDAADAEVRKLWQRLEKAGIPSLATRGKRPHVTLASAGTMPARARKALRAELARLSIPDLWFYTLGTLAGDDSLILATIVDTELLAVHTAVHDILAGKVSNPSAYYFPGGWIPHCALTQGISEAELSTGFAALQPPEPIRATIIEVGVTDTRTGEVEPLVTP